jgi:hypothetical protein
MQPVMSIMAAATWHDLIAGSSTAMIANQRENVRTLLRVEVAELIL